MFYLRCLANWGSSPLTRGKPDGPPPRAPVRGLIPAHAGKTKIKRTKLLWSTAHPRSRGENVVADTKKFSRAGSSPLTRGKHHRRRQLTESRGLIPAHAGKTTAASSGWHRSRAHPRSRGENRCAEGVAIDKDGSSPLTRGKPNRRSQSIRNRGLIPAHAGKTFRSGFGPFRAGAHPRSRGENVTGEVNPSARVGSSPLTRGKHRNAARCIGP